MGLAAALAAAAGLVVWLRDARTGEDLKPVPLVSLGGWAHQPAFSPDGNRVVFAYQAPPDKSGLYVVQVGGGPPVRLTSAKVDYHPAWSPDDRTIAFLRWESGKDSSIMLIPALGGVPPRELAKVQASYYSHMSWTPDARWLVLSARRSAAESCGIWLVSAETGEQRTLLPSHGTPNGQGLDGDMAGDLSPDGRVLVFARSLGNYNLGLYAVKLTRDLRPEGPAQKLTDQTYSEIRGMAWAGEREIVFGVPWAGNHGLFRTPVSGGTSPRRLSWSAGYAAWPTVARSQHRLVYTQTQGSQNLWRMDLRTGEYRMIVGSSYIQQIPQYSPDGRRIAFGSDRSGDLGLWTCDAEGENCRQLTSFGGSQGGSPRWSPDGRWLAFDSREEGKSQIYVIPAGGGAKRRLTSGNADNAVPSWSRDQRWIYFASDRSGQWRVWKAPAGGGEAVQVTHTAGGAAFESTDGKYLYFIPLQDWPALFRMPVAGGQEEQVVPRVFDWQHFGVTEKGVYFFSDPTTLQFLDEKTGLIRTVARLEKHSSTGGMTVSADDTYLIFAQADTREDLMLVEGFR
jgi:Tol biopolymer transport system component